MSRTTLQVRALFGAATAVAIFLTACDEPTAPRDERNGIPGSEQSSTETSKRSDPRNGEQGSTETGKSVDVMAHKNTSAPHSAAPLLRPSAAGPSDHPVADSGMVEFLVQTGVKSTALFGKPGSVTFYSPTVSAITYPKRSVTVNNIQVTDVPSLWGSVQTYACLEVFVWKWNGSSWGTRPVATNAAETPIYRYALSPTGMVTLPALGVDLGSAGSYAVTARITWHADATGFLGSRDFSFNAASDFRAYSGVTVGPGWITMK